MKPPAFSGDFVDRSLVTALKSLYAEGGRLQLTAWDSSSSGAINCWSDTVRMRSSNRLESIRVCTRYSPATGKVTFTKKLMLSADPCKISNGVGCETTSACWRSGI